MAEQKQHPIELNLSREVAEGGLSYAQVMSRIIMTPESAKRLLFALQDNIRKYEQMNGEIRLRNEAPVLPFDLNGGGQA